MRQYGGHIWKRAPMVRLIVPFVAGIVLYTHYSVPLAVLSRAGIAAAILAIFPFTKGYKWRWVAGAAYFILLAVTGCLLTHFQDIRNHPQWVGRFSNNRFFRITIQEVPQRKAHSFKTLATVTQVYSRDRWIAVKGTVLVYFATGSADSLPGYGTELVIDQPLQPIPPAGNPGGFDYREYCLRQGITHQVYLRPDNYFIAGNGGNLVTAQLIEMRQGVLSVFRHWVSGAKEAGVAEALLIGYRDDLDAELVRAYSNTGVVHIIAISGLHLGMIYGLMLLILRPLRNRKAMRWIRPMLVLAVLWGFSLLAGAGASILRSAVTFSFIVIGDSLRRRTQVFNTLAASAFCLLVFNPWFLYDVGFQLSYAAIAGILLFMKPIYCMVYCRNRLLDIAWEMTSITLAAQVFTLPLILCYFHQFPNLFLFTNFIAVPLSGLILYGELVLLLVYKIPFLGSLCGSGVTYMIRWMNGVITSTGRIPWAVTDHIRFSLAETLISYGAIGFFSWWMLEKRKAGLLCGVVCVVVFSACKTIDLLQRRQQHRLIVYNIPKNAAIDVVGGAGCRIAYGKPDERMIKYYLDPARLLYGADSSKEPRGIELHGQWIAGPKRSAAVVDIGFVPITVKHPIPVDMIIVSGSPSLRLARLHTVFDCALYVFDASNPLWKIRQWKKEADSLHLRHHTVSEQGAFETDL